MIWKNKKILKSIINKTLYDLLEKTGKVIENSDTDT